jgi:hypothetical protein
LAADGYHHAGIILGQIGNNIPGNTKQHCANRHLNNNIFAAFTPAALFAAILAVLGNEPFLKPESGQSVLVAAGNKNHITALTAVTAVRTAAINKFFTPETYVTVAAVAGFNKNMRFINKHTYISS